jgi:hypothetical protein
VPIPGDWGELAGVITALGHCELYPAALEGAEVAAAPDGTSTGAAFTAQTDELGSYRLWLPPGDYDVAVSAPGHASQVAAGVTITSQALTRLDFNLRSTLPCIRQIEWNKKVYVNGQPTGAGSLRFPVFPGDNVSIVDTVELTHTGHVTFSLQEEWSAALSLLDYEQNILPGGTLAITGSEITVSSTAVLSWVVSDLPADWTYVLTKTFLVGTSSSATETVHEELWVEHALQQPAPLLLTLDLPRGVYLPILCKNYGP